MDSKQLAHALIGRALLAKDIVDDAFMYSYKDYQAHIPRKFKHPLVVHVQQIQPVVVIHGDAGSGKSTLLNHIYTAARVLNGDKGAAWINSNAPMSDFALCEARIIVGELIDVNDLPKYARCNSACFVAASYPMLSKHTNSLGYCHVKLENNGQSFMDVNSSIKTYRSMCPTQAHKNQQITYLVLCLTRLKTSLPYDCLRMIRTFLDHDNIYDFCLMCKRRQLRNKSALKSIA